MKRILLSFILLFTACLLSHAQWFLFPGSGGYKAASDSTSLSEVPAESENNVPAESVPAVGVPIDSMTASHSGINVLFALPLKAEKGNPNNPMFDYYCGSMLALRNLGQNGLEIKAYVTDTGEGYDNTAALLKESDIVICGDGGTVLHALDSLYPGPNGIISPMERIAENSRNTIHVQTPIEFQIHGLAKWLKDDVDTGGGEVIVVSDSFSDTLEMLTRQLDSLDVRYRISASVSGNRPAGGTVRYVSVSCNEKFLAKNICDIAGLGENGKDVVFYSTSKARNLRRFEDSRIFYNANAHIIAQYAIDDTDERTCRFISDYRKMFGYEPNRFAFHGYDIAEYFLTAQAVYQNGWLNEIESRPGSGLQTKFEFLKSDGKYVNTATSRTIYNKDLSISVFR